MKIHSSSKKAFSLVEILVVLAIMSVLMGIGMKAFSGQGSQEFSKSLTQISGALELAQAQALSTRTPIRILIGIDDQDIIFLSLTNAEEGEATSDDKSWTPTSKPLVVKNIKFNDEFVPPTEGISLLSEGTPTSISRSIAGKEILFETMLQFSPQGEVTLNGTEKVSRGIQWGVESVGTKPQKALIRISCLTGRIETIREEDFLQSLPPQS